jgi:hypothetical protein
MTSATTDDETIIVTLASGLTFGAAVSATSGFLVEIIDRFGGVTNLPSGLTFDTVSAASGASKVTIILSGSPNSGLYWKENQRIRVRIPSNVMLSGGIAATSDVNVITTFRDLKPVTLTAAALSLTQFRVTLDDDWYTRSADGTLVYMGDQTATGAANVDALIPFIYTVDGAADAPSAISYNATTRVFTVSYEDPLTGTPAIIVTPRAGKIFDKNGNTNATAALTTFNAA